MTRQEFQELINQGPLILDGATGSNLMKAGMPKGVCTEQWILEHKNILIDLQNISRQVPASSMPPRLPPTGFRWRNMAWRTKWSL